MFCHRIVGLVYGRAFRSCKAAHEPVWGNGSQCPQRRCAVTESTRIRPEWREACSPPAPPFRTLILRDLDDIYSRRKDLAGSMVIDSQRRATLSRPHSPEERKLVLDQLGRLLDSPLLKQSQRYSRLLRYLVEEALESGNGPLKERIVGADVFGREASYDTTADPVVRTTAAQLRRRLAKYYQAPEHEGEIVFELPTGGYAVEFHIKEEGIGTEAAPREDLLPPERLPIPLASPSPERRPHSWTPILVAAGLAALTIGSYGVYSAMAGRGALSKFWKPVLSSPESTLICIGRPSSFRAQPQGATSGDPTIEEYWRANTVDWPPTASTAIAAMLKANGHDYHLGRSDTIALPDFQGSPAVLVGALNNQWTMKLDGSVRFRYGSDHQGKAWIEDKERPGQRLWTIDFKSPFSGLREDYGIIARFTDPRTGKAVVLASGIVGYGTKIAADFLTNERYMEELAARAPAGWERKNLEAVFSTSLLEGKPGPPRILETYFW